MTFQVGDKVQFSSCPFDEQIPEEMMMFAFLATQTMTVVRVSKLNDMDVPDAEPDGRWIITDLTTDWIDQSYFRKVEL